MRITRVLTFVKYFWWKITVIYNVSTWISLTNLIWQINVFLSILEFLCFFVIDWHDKSWLQQQLIITFISTSFLLSLTFGSIFCLSRRYIKESKKLYLIVMNEIRANLQDSAKWLFDKKKQKQNKTKQTNKKKNKQKTPPPTKNKKKNYITKTKTKNKKLFICHSGSLINLKFILTVIFVGRKKKERKKDW